MFPVTGSSPPQVVALQHIAQQRISISEVWNTDNFFNQLSTIVIEIFGHVLYTKT